MRGERLGGLAKRAAAIMTNLCIHPMSLSFQLVLNKEVVQPLFITNRSGRRTITFKVKTTSPRRYSVRPTRGILWSGDQEQVTITLRALRKPPSDADDCRDRFKVLSLPLDEEQAMQLRELPQEQRRNLLDQLWDSEEAVAHATVKKIHCSFELSSPSSCSPIPEEQQGRERWSSRPGSRDVVEASPPRPHPFVRDDSYASCTEDSHREPETPPKRMAPPARAAPPVLPTGGGLAAGEINLKLGLRQRRGWTVDLGEG